MLTQYKTYVLSHYIMAKVFVPLLKPAPESSFTFITGSGGGSSMVLFLCYRLGSLAAARLRQATGRHVAGVAGALTIVMRNKVQGE
jgi:hypothetical protein